MNISDSDMELEEQLNKEIDELHEENTSL